MQTCSQQSQAEHQVNRRFDFQKSPNSLSTRIIFSPNDFYFQGGQGVARYRVQIGTRTVSQRDAQEKGILQKTS